VQEVIDALETQIDSKLNDAVQGVRVVSGNCYVCLTKEDKAGALLETGLTLRGVKINLEDVSRGTITVALSGVPHDVPDSSVARVVANYGTVIGESKTFILDPTPLSKDINWAYENITLHIRGSQTQVATEITRPRNLKKKNQHLYLNSNRLIEKDVIIESLFINFKHTGAVTKFLTLFFCSFYVKFHRFSISQVFISKQMICLTSTCVSYLNKDLFLACFVYLILPPKLLHLTNNIKNLIFFK
jgi:hypothetical protein